MPFVPSARLRNWLLHIVLARKGLLRHHDFAPSATTPPAEVARSPWIPAVWKDRRGSTLLLAILILAALAILAASIAVVSMGDRNLSKYERHSVSALAAAETGIAFAKRTIANQSAPIEDYDSDGRPDFALQDTLSWGGSYQVIAEASDILQEGVAAYRSNGFTIVSEGRFRGATRRVRVEIVHDSFLKFARFIAQHNLQFECGDLMAGEVYAGGSITLSCGCPAGQEPHFLELVQTAQSMSQAECGVFERGYEEGVEEIDLLNSWSWDEMRDKARGIAENSSCEGKGDVGIYMNLPATDPLQLGTQSGNDQNAVVFSYFDFMDTSFQPPDTVITYQGAAVMNTLTGQPLRRREFNGIVFCEGDAMARGLLAGVSGYSLSLFATNHCLVTGDIVAGNDGFDPITRLPNQSGNPVTAALIAEDYVAMADYTPRVLRIDAAIVSRTSNWRCLGGMGNHPVGGPGPIDLDIDGINGETPYNNDPVAGVGWDELNITEKTWVLNLTGPIITYSTGDAYPWNAGPVLGDASGPTRRYNYNLNYMSFPPPCFPSPINLWMDVSWTEIMDSRSNLADHLPD